MPFDASSMDDNVSIISAISSIFEGDSSAEIDQLRTHRRILYSDAMRLQTEYRQFPPVLFITQKIRKTRDDRPAAERERLFLGGLYH